MSFRLFYSEKLVAEPIELPASKSISNRLLIMQALASKPFDLRNLSEADDTRLMIKFLNSDENELNADNAGTVYRFLVAYFSIKKGKRVLLTGSERMFERPIAPLVKALRRLGAKIDYKGEDGFPPLKIKGSKLYKKKIRIDSSKSSQFVSALLLIAPYVEDGLKIEMLNPTSKPYVDMTLSLMRKAGIVWEQSGNTIRVREGDYRLTSAFKIESDWSSAAFIYQAFALSSYREVFINDLKEDSLQGDAYCVDIFESLGISSYFSNRGVRLSRHSYDAVPLSINLKDHPDLILPFAVTAAYLLPSVKIKGISSLRVKESNRLDALRSELEKLADIDWEEEDDLLKLSINEVKKGIETIEISSHNDHRVAMCLAPLVMIYQSLDLDVPSVVVKSFPTFWQEVSKLGIKLGEAI